MKFEELKWKPESQNKWTTEYRGAMIEWTVKPAAELGQSGGINVSSGWYAHYRICQTEEAKAAVIVLMKEIDVALFKSRCGKKEIAISREEHNQLLHESQALLDSSNN